METDPKKRFSNRVEHYVKYRPNYPTAVLTCLQAECGLEPTAVIADIGSGTGILAELFLQNGNRVFGVEPNNEMRAAAESWLNRFPHFTSINGSAEATTLPADSVDFVTAGQAFHWFDPVAARLEFGRILKPGGYVALVWNERDAKGNAFMRAYEAFLDEYGLDYHRVKQTRSHDDIGPFFNGRYEERRFDNAQQLDFASFKGRFLSSSYAPLPGHPTYERTEAQLRALFNQYEVDGRIQFTYNTVLYFARLM